MALAKELLGVGFAPAQAAGINGGINTGLAAAGSTQADATAIATSYTIVTGADGTKGVILPAAQPGDCLQIVNSSASTLKVYPPVGAAITVPGSSMGSANAAYSHTTFAVCEYFCFSATQWSVQKSA
jgi:hypothetical protein